MKIIHFADLHLGVENYGHINPATGLSTRLLDFLAALDQVIDYALENKVDLVLFCGDAYKSREPGQTHQREFAKRINRLSTAGIPTPGTSTFACSRCRHGGQPDPTRRPGIPARSACRWYSGCCGAGDRGEGCGCGRRRPCDQRPPVAVECRHRSGTAMALQKRRYNCGRRDNRHCYLPTGKLEFGAGLCPPRPYFQSSRSATTGSTRVARRAGTIDAMIPMLSTTNSEAM